MECGKWAEEGRSIEEELARLRTETEDVNRVRRLLERRIEQSKRNLEETNQELAVRFTKR